MSSAWRFASGAVEASAEFLRRRCSLEGGADNGGTRECALAPGGRREVDAAPSAGHGARRSGGAHREARQSVWGARGTRSSVRTGQVGRPPPIFKSLPATRG